VSCVWYDRVPVVINIIAFFFQQHYSCLYQQLLVTYMVSNLPCGHANTQIIRHYLPVAVSSLIYQWVCHYQEAWLSESYVSLTTTTHGMTHISISWNALTHWILELESSYLILTYMVLAPPESASLPSAGGFTERFFSGARQRRLYREPNKKHSAKPLHSAKKALPSVK
jgi:hypothetical protein